MGDIWGTYGGHMGDIWNGYLKWHHWINTKNAPIISMHGLLSPNLATYCICRSLLPSLRSLTMRVCTGFGNWPSSLHLQATSAPTT